MKTYNTLDELYQDAKPHQVTAQEILNGRTWVLGEWQEIAITDELKEHVCKSLADKFGGRSDTKQRVFRSLMRERRQHWGLKRTVVEKYEHGTPAFIGYIAGQDMLSECKAIRNALK